MKYLLIALLFVWRPCMGQENESGYRVEGFILMQDQCVVVYGYTTIPGWSSGQIWIDSKLYKNNNGWHFGDHKRGLIKDFETKKIIIQACVDYITSLTDDRERRNDCLILDKIMQRINK